MGDGELEMSLSDHIHGRAADTQVRLLGYVQDSRAYLQAFDIFVLPSKKEGLPYALLESGAAGLPCIASNVGGIPEIIENRKNGLLIDPNDHQSIVCALEKLLASPELRRQYGEALQEKVAHEFSLEEMIAALQQALKSRVVIEQAKGMVAERSRLDIETAFDRMRSYARANNLRLADVSSRITSGEISPDVFTSIDGSSASAG